jgi:hypothetical protein
MNLQKEIVWPDCSSEMETMAAQLTQKEKETVAADESSIADEVMNRKGLQKLHLFLNDAFDGQYTDNFYGY